MQVKSHAVVLRTIKYSDTTSIAILYTEKNGMMSFAVHLPQRKSGRTYRLFHPMALLELEWPQKTTHNMNHARNVNISYVYTTLHTQPHKSALAIFLSEVLYYVLRGEQANGPLFEFICSSMRYLDHTNHSVANFHLVFLLQLSHFLGIHPNTERYKDGCLFDLQEGRTVMSKPFHNYYIGPTETHFIPLLERMNFRTMHLFHFTQQQRKRFLEILTDYYKLHVPDFPEIRSMDVFHELLS